MFCPSCQLVVRGEAEEAGEAMKAPCPVCGGTLRDMSASDAVELIEATALLGSGEPAANEQMDATRAVVRMPQRPLPVTLGRLSALPALAWQQPVVRAAVRTGASALALSLAVRAARAMVSGRRTSAAMTEGLLPAVADLFQSQPATRPASRPAPRVEIFETFIYVRRVVRR